MSTEPNGLIAVGDVLVNGFTADMPGVVGRSFVEWTARAADMRCTRVGSGGATSSSVVSRLTTESVDNYTYGVVAMGVNDAWNGDISRLRMNIRRVLQILMERCGKVVVLSVPFSSAANGEVTAAAHEAAVPVLDAALRGRKLMSPDLMHPTAAGQIVLADRVAEHWGLPLPSAVMPPGRPRARVVSLALHREKKSSRDREHVPGQVPKTGPVPIG